MGKRRIRNLQLFGRFKIIGFDLREDRCKEVSVTFAIETYFNWEIQIDFAAYKDANGTVLIGTSVPGWSMSIDQDFNFISIIGSISKIIPGNLYRVQTIYKTREASTTVNLYNLTLKNKETKRATVLIFPFTFSRKFKSIIAKTG